ncbi:hypothetical protein ACIBKY_04830 [Nonomuraea sp. NPDC050394]|uniref:hypothetical protein n=1 Tax=Nonomuraea sp. NPDC050394 TaxID=3364363 RepID=UPI0037A0532F
MIESLRAQGITWAQLAPALEVRSRQSAERRYLSLRGDPSGHAGTTRDHRAAQRAGQAFIAEHANRLRDVGRRLADLGDLQQRADAAAAAIHRAVDLRLHRYNELPSRADWPGRLRQALTADDLPAVLECLRRASYREMDYDPHHELQAEVIALTPVPGRGPPLWPADTADVQGAGRPAPGCFRVRATIGPVPEQSPDPDPQPVKIPPDDAGRLHRLRLDAEGEREGLVSWIEDVREGFAGGLVERQEWMPLLGLAPIDGVDCTRLPWDEPATTVDAAVSAVADDGRGLPDGWPPDVPVPGADGWPDKATGWLLEAMPPGYRAHRAVLATHPLQLARSAHGHTVRARDAVQESYRGAAVALRDQIPPEAITQVLEVHRAELARLSALQQAIEHVGQALLP